MINHVFTPLGDGVGDACEGDNDGDGIADNVDICPDNILISQTDFKNYQTIDLDPNTDSTQPDPKWVILADVSHKPELELVYLNKNIPVIRTDLLLRTCI